MAEHTYFAADATSGDERRRHSLMEQAQDALTQRYLTDRGLQPGWRCLEVGAGGGSIARWLAERVGKSGHVVATDLDVQFLEAQAGSNLEVRQHDILTDPLESATYDLVHCRALLMHLPDPAVGLTRMIDALRPGGRLLVEEADMGTIAAIDDEHPLAAAFDAAIHQSAEFVRAEGLFDSYFGRSVPRLLLSASLEDVGNEAVTQVVRGGDPWALYVMEGQHRLDPLLVQKGVVTEAQIEGRDRACADPAFAFLRGLIFATWGTKPN